MEGFKGTAGPWTGKDVHICQQDKAGLQIGFLMTFSDERRKEGAANAHLIAAAPELLEALQNLIAAYQPVASADNPAINEAIRAVNKALGQ